MLTGRERGKQQAERGRNDHGRPGCLDDPVGDEHTQAQCHSAQYGRNDAARLIREVKDGHYLMIVKASQPTPCPGRSPPP
jgi:hypothetical protein